MISPEKWEEQGRTFIQDAREFLPQLVSKMTWDSLSSLRLVMEVGCGNGYITKHVLLDHLRQLDSNCGGSEIWAIDISKDAIQHASLYHHDHDIKFRATNGLDLVSQMEGNFDKIFSFHTFHWIPEQGKIFKMFYELLGPGGEIGFYFIPNFFLIKILQRLKHSSKWSPHLNKLDWKIPETTYEDHVDQYLENLMREVGFQNIQVDIIQRTWVYDHLDVLNDLILACDPFVKLIPLDLQIEYKEELKMEISKHVNQNSNEGKPMAVQLECPVAIVTAKK